MSVSSIASSGIARESPPLIAPKAGESSNHILRLLPQGEMAVFLERSEFLEVRSKELLFEPGDRIDFVHFPEDCVISLVTVMANGDQVEAMTVGNDGFSGIPAF